MIAMKENKIFHIADSQVKQFLKDGYDIYDDNRVLLQRSPSATVPYAKYKAALDKIAELEGRLSKTAKTAKTAR